LQINVYNIYVSVVKTLGVKNYKKKSKTMSGVISILLLLSSSF